MFQEGQDPVELGTSNNIKSSATSGLYNILEKITLQFSKDGQKLTFIDNNVVVTHCLLTVLGTGTIISQEWLCKLTMWTSSRRLNV